MIKVSDRLSQLPPYLFSEFARKKKELESQGIKVIDLGIGAPDLATPSFIVEELIRQVQNPNNHKYPPYHGAQEFREAVSHYYLRHYGVELDPNTEVLALIGSKEGLANFIQSIINPGDTVLIPNPGYPVYRTSVSLAGGVCEELFLTEENGYFPNFSDLSQETKSLAKLMILNYPNNPTAATVSLQQLEEAVEFGRKENILIAHDAAYDLITFDDYIAPSILQVPQAKEVAIEFGSLSKSFNMTGWRIGYAVGNKELIQALSVYKSNIDTGQFLPIQKAASIALYSDLSVPKNNSQIFKIRMERMIEVLKKIGLKIEKPKGTIFLWARVPDNFTGSEFANKLLMETGIMITPGIAFGTNGNQYVRISLSIGLEMIDEIEKRLSKFTI